LGSGSFFCFFVLGFFNEFSPKIINQYRSKYEMNMGRVCPDEEKQGREHKQEIAPTLARQDVINDQGYW